MSIDLSNYVEVAERIELFRTKHPEGSYRTELVDLPAAFADKFIAVRAFAYRTPDDPAPGADMAWEPVPGKTPYTKDSELQNACTSAIGRAIIAALAADTRRGIVSREEVQNRQPSRASVRLATPSHKTVSVTDDNMEGAKWANRQKLLLLEALGDKESAKQAWVEVLETFSLTPEDEIPENARGSIEAELALMLAASVIEEQLPL